MVDMESGDLNQPLPGTAEGLLATLQNLVHDKARRELAGAAIVHLHDEHDMPYRDIAAATGIKRTTAWRWAHLARGAK